MILGHDRQKLYFSHLLRRGALAHAYLFFGPAGVGKETFAREVAKALICLNAPQRFGGCGTCVECRQVDGYSHPDLIFLSAQAKLVSDEEKRGIGIASIRELERRLGLSSWRGGMRVVLIREAGELTFEAQSALLKILEEPGRDVVFFLTAESLREILPTIRSRSVPISFTVLAGRAWEAVSFEKTELSPAETDQARHLARGRPGLFFRLAKDPAALRAARAQRRRFSEILSGDVISQTRFVEEARETPEAARAFFENAVHHFHERMHQGTVSRYDASLARQALKFLAMLETTAVNRRLALEAFFLELSLNSAAAAEL